VKFRCSSFCKISELYISAVVLENNDQLRNNLAQKLMPVREFFTVPVGGGYGKRFETSRG